MLAIDLCAGSGWAVACDWLGISELGIEIMPETIATRDAMGALTLLNPDGTGVDMTALPDDFCSQAPIQIAGPPCQTFSLAGNGEGRKQLTEVLRRIGVFRRTGVLERGGSGDPRTWLVLEPLRLAVHGRPTFIVWEQVPPVLPVWEACAGVLRGAGYSVWTGCLNAVHYDVPQVRGRAFLIARRDGVEAGKPEPTVRFHHERVSMSQACGWLYSDLVGFPRLNDKDDGGIYRARDLFRADGAAPTLTEKVRSWKRFPEDGSAPIKVTMADAAMLQTFPTDHPFQGSPSKVALQIANAVPPLLGKAILSTFLETP